MIRFANPSGVASHLGEGSLALAGLSNLSLRPKEFCALPLKPSGQSRGRDWPDGGTRGIRTLGTVTRTFP